MSKLKNFLYLKYDTFICGPYRRIKWTLIHLYDFCTYIKPTWDFSRGEGVYNLLYMLDVKLTRMGLYFFTKTYPDKKIGHELWETRKALRKYRSDSAEDDAQKFYEMMFFKEFGVKIPPYHFKSKLENGRSTFERVNEFPSEYTEKEKQAMTEWLEDWNNHQLMRQHYVSLYSAYRKDFFNKFEQYLDDWWD